MSGAVARWSGSVAVGLAAAGPDQGVGLSVFVVEEVGINRSVEARIVQFHRKIIAALGGALRPGGPYFGATGKNPGARPVFVDPSCLRDEAPPLGLQPRWEDPA